jgi:hypothetical protein
MYVGYLQDRKKLGFSCIKDVRAAKQISNLKNFIKRTRGVSVAYIVKKGKQIFILIFSKEVLVALLIFVKSISVNIDPDVYHLHRLKFISVVSLNLITWNLKKV